jgi:hypothetical protein
MAAIAFPSKGKLCADGAVGQLRSESRTPRCGVATPKSGVRQAWHLRPVGMVGLFLARRWCCIAGRGVVLRADAALTGNT